MCTMSGNPDSVEWNVFIIVLNILLNFLGLTEYIGLSHSGWWLMSVMWQVENYASIINLSRLLSLFNA